MSGGCCCFSAARHTNAGVRLPAHTVAQCPGADLLAGVLIGPQLYTHPVCFASAISFHPSQSDGQIIGQSAVRDLCRSGSNVRWYRRPTGLAEVKSPWHFSSLGAKATLPPGRARAGAVLGEGRVEGGRWGEWEVGEGEGGSWGKGGVGWKGGMLSLPVAFLVSRGHIHPRVGMGKRCGGGEGGR